MWLDENARPLFEKAGVIRRQTGASSPQKVAVTAAATTTARSTKKGHHKVSETTLEPADSQNTNGPVHDLSLIMENLSIQDPSMHGPPGAGPGGMPPSLGRPPPPPQQLPAQMFTTAAQLLDLTDSKDTMHYDRAELTPHREAHGRVARRAQVDGHSAELGSVRYASCGEGRSLKISS